MSDDVVQRARQALDGINDGPWRAEDRDLDAPYSLTTVYNVFHNGDTPDRDLVAKCAYDNAKFIAAAPDLVRDLADEVEQLEADRDTGFRQRMGEHKLRAQRDQARTETAKLRATIDRVQTLVDKQIAVSESHTEDDDFNTAQTAHVTASLLHRIRQALDG